MSLPLVWIDLEMTGLDHVNDSIMEVACAITNGDLELITAPFECIIHQSKDKLDQMDEWCLKTHGESGLTQKCIDSKLCLEEAQQFLLEYIRQVVPSKGHGILAGNSVHVDRIFLLKEFPQVIDYLHYRIVDVSTIKELAKRWSPSVFSHVPKKKLTHRAYDDIMESIDELKYYKQSFFKINP
jgi:oligoribonuclease